MFIVWGRKVVRSKIGFVANFCPVCRVKRAFRLARVGSVGHVYYISFGKGTLVGYENTCLQCRSVFKADPDYYAAIADDKDLPLDELVAQTFPNIDSVLAERLALEHRVDSDPSSLSADERRQLILSRFVALSPKVEARFASTHIDKEVGLSLVATFFLVLIVPSFIGGGASSERTDAAVLMCLGAGAALVTWQGLRSGRRFMRREVIPHLADALRPIGPSEGELRSVLAELTRLRQKMGKKLVISDLQVRIAKPAAPR